MVRDDQGARLWSRQGKDLTDRFPDLAAAAQEQLERGPWSTQWRSSGTPPVSTLGRCRALIGLQPNLPASRVPRVATASVGDPGPYLSPAAMLAKNPCEVGVATTWMGGNSTPPPGRGLIAPGSCRTLNR